MYFGSNIKLLRKRRKRSQEDVAQAVNIKRSSLSGYELGTSEPNFETLLAFSEYFKISTDKLLKLDLNRVSEMYMSQLEKGFDIDITGSKLRVLATTVNSENEENIELVPVKAKAGYTTGFSDPDFIKVLPTFQLPFLTKNRKYRTFQISGDSMPPVSDKSWVTGEFVQNWELIKNGYPYIVVTQDDGVVFKVVYNQMHKNQTLLLCSTNPEYKPYEIHVNEVVEMWKFVNYISSEMPEPNLSRDHLGNSVMELQKELIEIKNTLRDKQ
ncbi:XRE family transcriptional regulator [Acidiluteibacter ferrifornacis]|uniref:Helix-turn-helix domain-containing protein n=1 Tax=Acidiluteibacter ferrifornacis TaxID=2692424 RepID=A0A6N9NDK8_9FLAO|nr:LexA family transcriptional regulator [Acidiluteibacter ferrifornacis]MBR9830652.1 LexA family transcriptional regulator [bacterium]NBG64668.1 helix-turn-helix domain-containing protein [Acidiluteibacter ferrifornacis]